MKYKLLSIENKSVNNIGDYVQALAASQFLPQIDGFINREGLSDYDGEECKIIMNGWYMHDPTKWPPSPLIKPLFVAFHLNTSVANQMLTPEGVGYLKAHEPIGCRDLNTVELLKQRDIDAYFSGCLTLTLGRNYKNANKKDKVYFVDPIIPQGSFLKDITFMLSNLRLVGKLTGKLLPGHAKYKQMIIAARFMRIYSKVFSKETIADAIYISQQNAYYASLSNEDRLKEAERLVKLYAEALFVVTRRIHCALPCLGLETTVYFIEKENDDEISRCRFGGLTDLFNKIVISPSGLKCAFTHSGIICKNNIVKNSNKWIPLAESLSRRCSDFVASTD